MGITRNEISNPLDKRSAINEFTNEVIIDSEYGTPLPTNFRAIVLSGFGDQDMQPKSIPNSDGTGTEYFYFVRVRPMNVQEFTIPSPFLPMPACESKNLILSHPIAFVKSGDIGGKSPEPGGIYECRFLNDKKQTGIRIIEHVGSTKKQPINVPAGTGGAARAAIYNGGVGTVGSTQDTPPPPKQPQGNVDYPWINSFKGSKNPQDIQFNQGKCSDPSYPGLPKKTGYFFQYEKSVVVKAIKNSGQSISTQKIMYGIIKHEQGKLHFPGNNVAGIQLDFGAGKRPFGGANQSSFDYQFCLQDNGGDWRIFAGFNDLGKGMKVFGIIIGEKAKITGKHAWKPLEGTNDQQAERMTENYYVNWNTKFTRAEVETLKKTNQVVRDKKVYTRHWKPSKKVFVKAFQEFEAL